MANKKYYWLKLKNTFFDEVRMKRLRKLAGGNTYTIIYLKLMLLSLQDEGRLFFEGVERSFADEIALILDESADDVAMTISYLKNVGLIEEISEHVLFLPETVNLTGSETDSAKRMREHREKKKALALSEVRRLKASDSNKK